MLFEDRTVWVAGTAQPTMATARAFVAEGAHVALLGRDVDVLEAAAASISATGRSASSWPLPSGPEAVEKIVQLLLEESERVDVLVTIPEIVETPSFLETTADEFEGALEAGFREPMNLMRAVLPSMIKNRAGAIVNVVAAGGDRGLPGAAAHAAASAATINLSRSVGEEMKRTGVRINCVAVGPVESSPFTDSPGFEFELKQGNDATRLQTLTHSVLFLASDMSAGVSCQVVMARGANRW